MHEIIAYRKDPDKQFYFKLKNTNDVKGKGKMDAKKVKSKIYNFFYYYKWHILIALFFIAILTVLTVQMVTREKYDLRIMYAGNAILSDEDNTELCEALKQFGADYNGDGKITSEVFDLIIMNDEQLQKAYEEGQNPYFLNETTVQESRETFTFQSMAGEYALLFLSPDCYKLLKENGYVVPLDSFLEPLEEGETEPFTRYDDGAVYLNSLNISVFYSSFAKLPDDTLVCIKKVKTTGKGDSEAEINQKNHIEVFKKILMFELPEDFVPSEQNG